MPSQKPAILKLAAEWGFIEDETHSILHMQIVSAINKGEPTRGLWNLYVDTSESQVDFPKNGPRGSQARAGRQIVQGLIYLDADEIVQGLSYLLLAETIARNQGLTAAEHLLTAEIAKHGSEAEQRQAEAYYFEDAQDQEAAKNKFEAALAIYFEAEDDKTLTDAHRGLINRHIAECYLGLLRIGARDAEWLQEQIVATLESALSFQEGSEFARGQAMLDQVSRENWWLAAVERQQA